jgi:hypothetical protein
MRKFWLGLGAILDMPSFIASFSMPTRCSIRGHTVVPQDHWRPILQVFALLASTRRVPMLNLHYMNG